MRYMRCQCGAAEKWTSMGSRDCEGCKKCNTTFSEHPEHHKPLQSHVWVERYNQNTGKSYKVCSQCNKTDQTSYKEAQIIDDSNQFKNGEVLLWNNDETVTFIGNYPKDNSKGLVLWSDDTTTIISLQDLKRV